MFGILPRAHTITTAAARRATVAGPLQRAFIHAQYDSQEHDNVTQNSSLHSLGARLGLQALDRDILRKAMTHKSLEDQDNNAGLEFIGKRVTGLCATEYFHCKYPEMHPVAFDATLQAYIGNRSISRVGSNAGLEHSIRWKAPQTDDEKLGHSTVMADCMNALVGAIYQEQGFEAAKKFIHGYILTRDFDVKPLLKVEQPKRHLTALLKKHGKPSAISRLVSETGRQSSSPVFVVGVFSGEEKLGEGFGSSLKMAEHSALQDALYQHYGKVTKDFTLPSDASKVEKYTPTVLGNTQAII
ncbi:ribonuclease III domain-containing protein [Phycomyces nitens]|nr:ribonuclease III domain-containing protein [Phycomyces nitens]